MAIWIETVLGNVVRFGCLQRLGTGRQLSLAVSFVLPLAVLTGAERAVAEVAGKMLWFFTITFVALRCLYRNITKKPDQLPEAS
jgi:hypothetical protein